jgi:hypothetical protein
MKDNFFNKRVASVCVNQNKKKTKKDTFGTSTGGDNLTK